LLLRPPPTPPLFPYTTLFRSVANDVEVPKQSKVRRDRSGDRREPLGRASCAQLHEWPLMHEPDRVLVHLDHLATTAIVLAAIARDRKSTRLNSSHVKISYAVF